MFIKGLHWYNNGEIELLAEECPKDFLKGRLSMSEETKRKMSENNYIKKITPEKEKIRREKISKTKQNKSQEEKLEYSKKLSQSRKGKGLGIIPWNKGKKGLQKAWNKGLSFEECHDSSKEEMVKNINKTKRENNSFNISNKEEEYYKELCKEYGEENIIRQYYDAERYPYNCDFYIKTKDLFIELNATWTHGGKPYNAEDKECQEQLKLWEEKSKTSKYYRNAIYTWTDLDVRKQTCAKQNNLNYKTIY